MSLIVGVRAGIVSGVKAGINGDAGPAVPTDGPNNFRFPETLADFDALGEAQPTSLYLCQDASGSLADVAGTYNLSTAGTGHLYQQAVAGYTRLAVGAADAASAVWRSVTVPDPATTSFLLAAYILVSNDPAAERITACIGSTTRTNVGAVTSAGAKMRTRSGANVATGTAAINGVVHLVLLQSDVTNSVVRTANNSELLTPTYAAPAGVQVALGQVSASTPDVRYLWAAMWTGAAAEKSLAGMRSLHAALTGVATPW